MFTLSCSEDAADLTDFSATHENVLAKNAANGNVDDNIDYRPKPDYEDPDNCLCYLTVDNVTGDGVEYLPSWSLEIPGTSVNIQKNINFPGWAPVTSIVPTGDNTFMLTAEKVPTYDPETNLPNPPEYVGLGVSLLTIESTVKCYLKTPQQGGAVTLNLATETQHTFKGSDGFIFPDYSSGDWPELTRGFNKTFACYYLSSDIPIQN